jgi:hypothetical protein
MVSRHFYKQLAWMAQAGESSGWGARLLPRLEPQDQLVRKRKRKSCLFKRQPLLRRGQPNEVRSMGSCSTSWPMAGVKGLDRRR